MDIAANNKIHNKEISLLINQIMGYIEIPFDDPKHISAITFTKNERSYN